MKHEKIKRLSILAMLCAVAYVIVVFARIPIVLFLKYEPKDAVITIGGFLFGPLSALAVSAVVSFLEMLTVSDTGWIGLVMNVLSTAAFSCTAALIYKKKRTQGGAILGLICGALLMTLTMVLWNYLITPLYMGTSRADVASMLLPVFLPFNLVKSGLNASITILLYKPVAQGLRKARLLPPSVAATHPRLLSRLAVYAGALALLAACVVLSLVLSGVL